MLRVVLAAAFSLVVVASPLAQVCNSMTGSLKCGSAPRGYLPGVGEGLDSAANPSSAVAPLSTLGSDIIGAEGGDQPGTIGAITFGSGGRRCSGLFRSVNC
jgi:hypothetical protein